MLSLGTAAAAAAEREIRAAFIGTGKRGQRLRARQEVPAGVAPRRHRHEDGFSVEYIYDNDMHLDYSQLYLHPRAFKDLPNGQWYMIFGSKGTVDLTIVRQGGEDAMTQFFACIREKRAPIAGIDVAATAALTAIMGREVIYRRRMVTWVALVS